MVGTHGQKKFEKREKFAKERRGHIKTDNAVTHRYLFLLYEHRKAGEMIGLAHCMCCARVRF